MAHQPPSTGNPTISPAELEEHYRRFLDELIEAGMALVRLVHQRAMSQEAATPPESGATPAADAAVAFDRVCRAVRRCIMLSMRLNSPARALTQHRETARRRIIREVEDAIQRIGPEYPDYDDEEDLEAELLERLDSPDIEEDIGNRPVAEIIADICRDLGLAAQLHGTQPWKRRTPSDIALLCARAARPPEAQITAVPHRDPPPASSDAQAAQPGQDRPIRLVPSPNDS